MRCTLPIVLASMLAVSRPLPAYEIDTHYKVPDDFTPGDPEHGLPPSLQIPFGRDGRVLTKESVSASWRQWLKAAEYSADVVVSLEDYRRLSTEAA